MDDCSIKKLEEGTYFDDVNPSSYGIINAKNAAWFAGRLIQASGCALHVFSGFGYYGLDWTTASIDACAGGLITAGNRVANYVNGLNKNQMLEARLLAYEAFLGLREGGVKGVAGSLSNYALVSCFSGSTPDGTKIWDYLKLILFRTSTYLGESLACDLLLFQNNTLADISSVGESLKKAASYISKSSGLSFIHSLRFVLIFYISTRYQLGLYGLFSERLSKEMLDKALTIMCDSLGKSSQKDKLL